jgi:alpha-galactosidase
VDLSAALNSPHLVHTLPNGVSEYVATGKVIAVPGLVIDIVLRIADSSPILRFRYVLRGAPGHCLTKPSGADDLRYISVDLAQATSVSEVRFSEFNNMVHSYCLSERDVASRQFDAASALMGPMLVAHQDGDSSLIAYEHGSQTPDDFLHYRLRPDRTVALEASKGNYCDAQPVEDDHPYETVWLHFGAVFGSTDDLADAYREFVLKFQSPNLESRKPYIFYNTWNFQERNKWWNDKPYLESMHQKRILEEIDIAHRMGIDVYVLDTGWYEKTGDWRVNLSRFPDGLKSIKQRLDRYGMKLGLWFDPTAAAVSSAMLQNNADCVREWNGEKGKPHPIWETEDSCSMCLASRYHEAFADELIRLVKEVGVTYFKWDAIGQYGCDAPGHLHGTEANTREERADNYAFELGRAMSKVVDKLVAACPEAIVDFDITEGGRYVGLGFLSSGKYFLINNGPYYRSLDDPQYAPGGGMGSNVYVFPGPARGEICRTPLTFDKWVPSVLFLTHYLPDDNADSQWINIASLVLGQNGIWGDLPKVSAEGVDRIGTALGKYKAVRDDITASPLIRSGAVGGSPEIYEKIDPATGRGVVSIFSTQRGVYEYITESPVDALFWASEGATVTRDPKGRAIIRADFTAASARVIFFGVQ